MKKSVLLVLTGMVLVLTGSGGISKTACAADVTAGADFASAYVWRGITFNDGRVAQPYIDITSDGFGINIWGNMDIDDYDDTLDSGEVSEVDLTLSHGFSLEPVDVSLGYIEYLFPAGPDGTREVFLGLAAELMAGFSVGITGYYDFDEVDDYYINAAVGYGYDFDNGISLGLGAEAGFAGDDASAGKDGGFHEYMFSADCSYAVTEAVVMSAFMAWADNFDKDVLPDQDTDLFGGAGISVSF